MQSYSSNVNRVLATYNKFVHVGLFATMPSMKITKYEHSCVVLEQDSKRLVIDPGKFSDSFTDYSNIYGVVITHIHSDHLDEDRLEAILEKNPEVKIFSNSQVVGESKIKMQAVKAGDKEQVGEFSLEFFGGDHELYDGFKNIAVLVNNTVFHPGDSYTLPGKPIKVLCAPASAPWLRVSEASEFIKNARAETTIPIHNALLSEIGESIHYRILGEAAQQAGKQWRVLKVGENLEI